jgi:hypothetical protein
MKIAAVMFASLCAIWLQGCGEWSGIAMRNPVTHVQTACLLPGGQLSDEDASRVRGCVAACQSVGFQLEPGEAVPPAPATSAPMSARPALPLVCQAAASSAGR